MKPGSILIGLLLLAAIVYLLSRARSGTAAREPPRPPRDVPALVRSLAQPAVQITAEEPQPNSYFGGLPPAFPGSTWPSFDGRPLGFLACIDLSEVPRAIGWLPDRGRLLFFYDEEQPWGYDPKDRGRWKVVYIPNPSTISGEASPPRGLKPASVVRRRPIGFRSVSLPPSSDAAVVESLSLSDSEAEALDEYRSGLYGKGPHHQIGGYPDPVQNAGMELECQLASSGVYVGDPSGYKSAKAKALEAGAPDWRLLLQVDSDDDLGVMWGDAGMLYFWVREQDAREGNFDNVWLILQCY